MRRRGLIALTCVFVLGSAVAIHLLAANAQPPPTPIYNPYPPGILPPNLDSEILRVRSEIRTVFSRYLEQWEALPAPIVTGNPPTLQGNG